MARTQALDYEQRREFIIEKAAKLFSTHSFHGTSISDLAESCKMSKSLIYHYYDSKEDILFAVMESHVDQLLAAADEIASSNAPPGERLLSLIHSFMHLYVGAADRQRVLLNELGALPEDKRAEVISGQRRIIAVVEDLLSSLQPALREDSPRRRAAAMLFFGMINWTHIWFNPEGPLTADDLAGMSGKLLLDGLKGLS